MSFREALRFWFTLGFISFGGPAGQVAIMHFDGAYADWRGGHEFFPTGLKSRPLVLEVAITAMADRSVLFAGQLTLDMTAHAQSMKLLLERGRNSRVIHVAAHTGIGAGVVHEVVVTHRAILAAVIIVGETHRQQRLRCVPVPSLLRMAHRQRGTAPQRQHDQRDEQQCGEPHEGVFRTIVVWRSGLSPGPIS